MENLIRQTRVKFSGVGQENKEEPASTRERIPPLQRTQSFKGERKNAQNWFKRQFARQMSGDYDSNDSGEYATAVAAAAFAIESLKDSDIAGQKKISESRETSLARIRSKRDDTTTMMPEPGSESKRFSDELDKSLPGSAATEGNMREKAIGPTPSIAKAPSFADNTTGGKLPERTPHSSLIETTSKFADKPLSRTSNTKPETAAPKPDVSSTKETAFPLTQIERQSSTRSAMGETKADAWEKAELAKIIERYEKLKSTIQSWESGKKRKAQRRRDKTESELERRRSNAYQRYRSEMLHIDQIAGGARAQAEEKQRKEVLKVQDKANKIRATGKLPTTCFCF